MAMTFRDTVDPGRDRMARAGLVNVESKRGARTVADLLSTSCSRRLHARMTD